MSLSIRSRSLCTRTSRAPAKAVTPFRVEGDSPRGLARAEPISMVGRHIRKVRESEPRGVGAEPKGTGRLQKRP